nr:PREDICTED: exonuclease 3'-5' domain-containing protein 1 isoform X2 [Latimeria chalumnae]|eukprot:XP_014347253.1 PREDICTED: exonuclease 3'-5' domain-containing protein 1 isoform X2 [Latimeria chalumnae]
MEPACGHRALSGFLQKRVRVTLASGSYSGVIQHIGSSRTLSLDRVELLDEVEQCKTKNVAFSSKKASSSESAGTVTPAHTTEDQLETVPQRRHAGTMGFHATNYSSLVSEEEDNVDYIVIDEFQHNFGFAMLHIKKQNVVGVAVEGVNICRHGKLCWIQIATKSRVYLFDVLHLGLRAFKNGLTMILEDRGILKVIHDCRWISDCLYSQYGVNLKNVFDTQVADVLQFSMETGGFLPQCVSTLEETLVRHLEMPLARISFLRCKVQAVKENPEVWCVRPLPLTLLRTLALEVQYLQPLRLVLMDKLMTDYTCMVDNYLSSFREQNGEIFGSTELSSLELPAELRQFRTVQCNRRARAEKQYKMDKDGLLVRSSPESKSGLVGTPSGQCDHKAFSGCSEESPAALCPSSGVQVLELSNQLRVVEEEKSGRTRTDSVAGSGTVLEHLYATCGTKNNHFSDKLSSTEVGEPFGPSAWGLDEEVKRCVERPSETKNAHPQGNKLHGKTTSNFKGNGPLRNFIKDLHSQLPKSQLPLKIAGWLPTRWPLLENREPGGTPTNPSSSILPPCPPLEEGVDLLA